MDTLSQHPMCPQEKARWLRDGVHLSSALFFPQELVPAGFEQRWLLIAHIPNLIWSDPAKGPSFLASPWLPAGTAHQEL